MSEFDYAQKANFGEVKKLLGQAETIAEEAWTRNRSSAKPE